MRNEDCGGMEFYFPVRDRVFHWVRNSSLYSPAARQRQIAVRTMFRQEEIGASVPVFDRFETGCYFRKLQSLCLSAGVPYLVDLDDLLWDLPEFSISFRIPPKYLLAFPESLMSGAAAITVSTTDLKEQVEHRFPEKPGFLVENCLPAWIAPRSGVLIANTDTFKMRDDQIGWSIDLLRLIFQHGLSIQLLGQNQNLLERCSDIVVHSLPAMDCGSYLRTWPSRTSASVSYRWSTPGKLTASRPSRSSSSSRSGCRQRPAISLRIAALPACTASAISRWCQTPSRPGSRRSRR